jgi:uncharacterized protein YheU (UPF0270 family)
MRTRIIQNTFDSETTEHVIDMVAKALLARTDRQEAVITWDELHRAANMKCVILKHADGVSLLRDDSDDEKRSVS